MNCLANIFIYFHEIPMRTIPRGKFYRMLALRTAPTTRSNKGSIVSRGYRAPSSRGFIAYHVLRWFSYPLLTQNCFTCRYCKLLKLSTARVTHGGDRTLCKTTCVPTSVERPRFTSEINIRRSTVSIINPTHTSLSVIGFGVLDTISLSAHASLLRRV